MMSANVVFHFTRSPPACLFYLQNCSPKLNEICYCGSSPNVAVEFHFGSYLTNIIPALQEGKVQAYTFSQTQLIVEKQGTYSLKCTAHPSLETISDVSQIELKYKEHYFVDRHFHIQ
jgi:hypothetical protein